MILDKKYYFFDLDGTLTESGEGILNSAKYALGVMGYPIPPEETLRKFIGPPLKDVFMSQYKMDEKTANEAVVAYRRYFTEKGIFENRLYDGIKELLEKMSQAGKKIILCTSKPEKYSLQILERFGIKDCFHFIAGAVMDGVRSRKPEIIGHIFDTLRLPKEECVMIGDTEYDVLGAKEFSITSVGVLYGYGTRESLEKAGADYLVENTHELSKLIFD